MEADRKDSQKLPPNPQSLSNILSKLTLSWTMNIFMKGSKKELEIMDLYSPLEEHKSGKLGDTLSRCWLSESETAKSKDRKPKLLTALLNGFGMKMMMFGIIMFVGQVFLRIAQPLLLAQMLKYFSPDSTMGKGEAWLYALGVVLCTATSVVVNNPLWLGLLHHAMKLRVACCSVIYRKSLRLSKAALGQTTVGQVVNLMTNDVNRFDMGIIFIHYLWIGPVTTVVVTFFLWQQIGVAALVGVAALLVSIPAQMWLGKQKSSYRLKTAKRTDERIRLMNEIINGISVIKMYTWEKPFEKLVTEARRLEIKEIRGSSYITGIMLSFLLFNNRLAIFCSIVTYVLMGNLITASIVYVVTDFFTLVRQMMSDFFPLAIGLTAEILVSIKRIETFLLYNEMRGKSSFEENGKDNLAFSTDQVDGDIVKVPPVIINSGTVNSVPHSIVLKEASAKWSEESFEETLTDINIEFLKGKLTVLIGPVGSGKSSILQMILKELPLSNGFLHISGSLSYAAQEPWLFEGSVRQNILFGSPYIETRYRLVIRACALRTDLEQLPHGDQTLVGDRGVVLSGGQRARINMARAVYRESDIYLLDDPLSAVDTHVGKHLFEQCISGFLKTKTVILVTHQLQFLGSADHIVFLKDGSIKAQGSYQALKSSGTDFSKMIFDNKEDEEDESTKEGTFKRTVSQSETTKYEAVEEVEEMRTKGTVSGQVFRSYMTAGGHWTSMVFLLFMFCLTQFIGSAGDYWLNYWPNTESLYQRHGLCR
uniref:ABC transmembrane type-1 domain-containing protein n=1 Tax=Graphocephala atropunctata TaxID=36148 RepID=A0A1B6L2F8_9HEMI